VTAKQVTEQLWERSSGWLAGVALRLVGRLACRLNCRSQLCRWLLQNFISLIQDQFISEEKGSQTGVLSLLNVLSLTPCPGRL